MAKGLRKHDSLYAFGYLMELRSAWVIRNFFAEKGATAMSERDAYVDKLKAQLDAWNAELDKLDAEVRKAKAETKVVYEQRIKGLRTKAEDARQKLDEFREAKEGAWKDLKEGAVTAWDALKEGIEGAKAEFNQR
jgi:predicted  nucleic acid-binding Zn-ribbon protein